MNFYILGRNIRGGPTSSHFELWFLLPNSYPWCLPFSQTRRGTFVWYFCLSNLFLCDLIILAGLGTRKKTTPFLILMWKRVETHHHSGCWWLLWPRISLPWVRVVIFFPSLKWISLYLISPFGFEAIVSWWNNMHHYSNILIFYMCDGQIFGTKLVCLLSISSSSFGYRFCFSIFNFYVLLSFWS